MKTFIITAICCAFTSSLFAQGGVVSAPVLEAQTATSLGLLGGLQTSLAAIEEAEKKVEKIKEKAEWINKLKSIQEFITLLETVACMVRDFNANFSQYNNFVGSRASCYMDFNYQINITKLRKSVDIINLVISDGFSMDRGERMQAYETAYSNFLDSQQDLHALDALMRRKMNQYKRDFEFKKSLAEINGVSAARRR